MYGALIQLDSYFGLIEDVCTGNNADEIIEDFEQLQDLHCLVNMGRDREGPKGQAELDKLEEIIVKYRAGTLTIDDIRGMDVKLSVGSIKCVKIVEGEKQIEELKASLH